MYETSGNNDNRNTRDDGAVLGKITPFGFIRDEIGLLQTHMIGGSDATTSFWLLLLYRIRPHRHGLMRSIVIGADAKRTGKPSEYGYDLTEAVVASFSLRCGAGSAYR